ncbi:TPA: hypothetical protein JAJ28_003061 [Aeromonas hydrophila]|uniref:Uncharacterized protein n=1 Tax=Aeromonas hydrophila TaxID=644 RepID=A0AAD3UE96_AERHY|nr:hypothetical protein [Aeromonas hydrophila]
MQKNYSKVVGATFRERLPLNEIQEFTELLQGGSYWVGIGNHISKMQVTVDREEGYLEMLIKTTTNFSRGDYMYKVTATNEYGDTLVLVHGRIRFYG